MLQNVKRHVCPTALLLFLKGMPVGGKRLCSRTKLLQTPLMRPSFLLLLALLLTGCIHHGLLEGQWKSDDMKGWRVADFKVFRFCVPGEMRNVPVHGIDSVIGELKSPRVDLSFDYGWYTGGLIKDLPDNLKRHVASLPGFGVEDTTIDGFAAEIWSHRPPDPVGMVREHPGAKTNFLSLKVVGLGHDQRTTLSMSASCRTTNDYATARLIFSSIKFNSTRNLQ